MKLYDFALVLVRVIALTNVIEGIVSIPFAIFRLAMNLYIAGRLLPIYLLLDGISRLTFPLEEIASGLAFLIFSKAIARFAAKVVLSLSDVFS